MQTELKVNILLIDDQPTTLLEWSAILQRLGENLVTAHSAEEGLNCLLHDDFAVILLNVRMPGMEGFEIARQIRERPIFQHIPIIFITALHADDRQVLSGYSLGAVDYVFKPIVPDILRSKVAMFVSLFQKIQQVKAQLQQAIVSHTCDTSDCKQADTSLQKAYEELELRVAERTTALKQANDELLSEIVERRQAELALRKSEQKYRTLVETIPHGIGEIETNGIITFCNSILEKMLGYGEGELLGQPLWCVMPEPDRSNLPRYLAELMQDQPQPTSYVGKFLTKDGNLLDLQTDWNYKRDRQGRVTGLIAVVTDITKRKQAEAALRESQRLTEQIADTTPSLLWIYDLSQNCNIYANRRSEEFFGCTQAQMRAKDSPFFPYFLHPEDFQRLFAANQPLLALKDGEVMENEIRLKNAKGEWRWFQSWNVIFTRTAEGKPEKVLWTAIDITERKQLAAQLAASEERFRTSIDNMLDCFGIYTAVRDASGAIVDFLIEYVNAAACANNHLTKEEQIGKHLCQLMPSHRRIGLFSEYVQLVETGQPLVKESVFYGDVCNDDHFSPAFEIRAVKLGDGFAAAWRDITEQKQAEEMRRALEAEKELRKVQLRFFSMASHEFRTPLSTILVTAQLLKACAHEWSLEKRLRNLQRIETTAKNMTQLLDDILTINRAETGKLEYNPQPIEIEQFCHLLVDDLQLNAGAKHHITFVSQGQCPDVCFDAKLLRSLLTNLISNAIKYSPQGGEIHFRLTCEPAEVIFQIQDPGIGIPLEDQQHLFKSFYRGRNIDNIPGTGLGLTVVKKCLDLQRGKISFTSNVGVGTTVTVTIPC